MTDPVDTFREIEKMARTGKASCEKSNKQVLEDIQRVAERSVESCEEELDASEDTAYFQGKLYHPSCLGEILEAQK